MHIAKSILFVLSGAAAGVAFVISCGDDWHLGADAAAGAPEAPACDCPAAEPPLADRFEVRQGTDYVDANSASAVHVYCPEGAQMLSGSCTVLDLLPSNNVNLRESGFIISAITGLPVWRCSYINNGPERIEYRIATLCLKPPS